MAVALKSLPFGTAYVVLTGIGAAGSVIVGIILFSESADPIRALCLMLIVAGMVGLKLNSLCSERLPPGLAFHCRDWLRHRSIN